MRKLIIVFGILAVTFVLIFNARDTGQSDGVLQESMDSNDSAVTETVVSEPNTGQKPSVANVDSGVETTEKLVVDEQKLQAAEEELQALIREYDQNLSNREKRAEIEQRAALVAEQYKQEVLKKVKAQR